MNDKEKIEEAVKLIDELIDNMSETQRLSKELNQSIMDQVRPLAKLKGLLTSPVYDDLLSMTKTDKERIKEAMSF